MAVSLAISTKTGRKNPSKNLHATVDTTIVEDGILPAQARILVGLCSWPSIHRLPVIDPREADVRDSAVVLPVRAQVSGP